ncbi:MAG: hypothetical protein Q7T41_00010 [Candidatus Saccharibacteria bacterium]|nr:hypothetical protein [Candidatus Saccharibacteria bacterium]
MSFELVSILETVCIPEAGAIFCSQTTKNLQLFGKSAKYATDKQIYEVGKLIRRVNNGESIEAGKLMSVVDNTKLPIFACTEISMLAFNENLSGADTLEQTINEVVRRIS